jgi:hypothetical protein
VRGPSLGRRKLAISGKPTVARAIRRGHMILSSARWLPSRNVGSGAHRCWPSPVVVCQFTRVLMLRVTYPRVRGGEPSCNCSNSNTSLGEVASGWEERVYMLTSLPAFPASWCYTSVNVRVTIRSRSLHHFLSTCSSASLTCCSHHLSNLSVASTFNFNCSASFFRLLLAS